MSPARITLGVVVRDEEAMLTDCVRSAVDHVDDVLVLDTGSTDGTVALAESLGARVAYRPWDGDFSAARNALLDAAEGDFVFFLDADERLAPESGVELRRLVEAESPDAPPTVYLPLIVNVDQRGASLGADHMARLLRRRPELRYSGRVHEQIARGEGGVRRVFTDALKIVHLGYDPEYRAARGKAARNVELLSRELDDRPDDPALRYYLAKERYAAGEDDEALEGFRWVIDDASVLNYTLSAYVFAAECLRGLGRPEEAMQLAMEGLRRARDYGELWYVAGRAALEAGRPIQAEGQLREAHKVPAGLAAIAFRDPSVAAWRADVERGRALLQQGEIREAIELWTEIHDAVPAGPDRLALNLDLVDADLALGDQQSAWARLEPLLDAAPEEAAEPLLRFINLYAKHLGLEAAYQFVEDCVAVHRVMLGELRVAGAAAELAQMLEDEDRAFPWLKICVQLNSPFPQHYHDLARLLTGRGEHEAAESVRAAGARLAESG